MTTDKVILDRLEKGREHLAKFAAKVKHAAARYRDSSGKSLGLPGGDTGHGRRDQPVGEINNLAINARQKAAAIAFASPDWSITAEDPEDIEIARTYIRDLWIERDWVRIVRRALLFRIVGGMGFVAYLWDPAEGFVLEFVHPKDLIVDPNVLDETWHKPRYGGRKVRMPVEEAYVRYGKEEIAEEFFDKHVQREARPDENTVEIKLYWDRDTEAEAYGDRVLRKVRNEYDGVPIVPLQGDVNLDGEFSLGDYDQGLGAMEMIRRLQNLLNDAAQNGAGIPWFRADLIDESVRDQYIAGTYRGPLPINGMSGEEAAGYTSNMQLNEALLHALQYCTAGLDSDQGVTDLDRGVRDPTQRGELATQTMLRASRSSSRGAQQRGEFERFCERITRALVKCTVSFGLDPRHGEVTEQSVRLWYACKQVNSARIIEESTAYKDPAVEQTSAMQLLQTMVSAMPLLLQLAAMGAARKLPDITRFIEDVLRTSRRHQLDKYFLSDEQFGQAVQFLSQQQAAEGESSQGAQKPPRTPAETIAYKDAPPDIRRQIEAQAGLKPSQYTERTEQAHEVLLEMLEQEGEEERQALATNEGKGR